MGEKPAEAKRRTSQLLSVRGCPRAVDSGETGLMRLFPLVVLAAAVVPATATDPPPKTDRHGDPLPPGADQRLGTIRHRVLGETFQFTPDGKSIVAIGWG